MATRRKDARGIVFLEFPPAPFKRIIDHLRMMCFMEKGGQKRTARAAPTGQETQEVLELAELLDLESHFEEEAKTWCCRRRRPQKKRGDGPKAQLLIFTAGGGHQPRACRSLMRIF